MKRSWISKIHEQSWINKLIGNSETKTFVCDKERIKCFEPRTVLYKVRRSEVRVCPLNSNLEGIPLPPWASKICHAVPSLLQKQMYYAKRNVWILFYLNYIWFSRYFVFYYLTYSVHYKAHYNSLKAQSGSWEAQDGQCAPPLPKICLSVMSLSNVWSGFS